jgi:ABC-type transport system involved in cytochrome bd biosynthesis fused ATPase/permease subunit
MSGGERRILAMVAALIGETPVDVVDVVTGLDRANLHLVLAALAHAAGSHEHADVVVGTDGVVHLTRPGPVVAWPT